MAVEQTVQMLAPFVQIVDVRNHFSGLFKVPRSGIHNASKVKVDIKRSIEDIAFPMKDPSAGWHSNERRGWSSKELAPAAYKEKFSISADDLMGDRAFGKSAYENPALILRLRDEIGPLTGDLQDMIARGLEIQASQIMTTGALDLIDDAGVTVFSENFAPKTAHFPDASVDWATTASAVPLTDIADLGDLIKQDGHRVPRRAHQNSTTFEQMLATDSVKAALNNDYRMDNGEIYRMDRGGQPAYEVPVGGGVYRGTLRCRNYIIDMYTYDEGYNHPQTGTFTKYLPDYKCVVESGGRMDATFGQINSFGTDGSRIPGLRIGGGTAKPMTNYTILTWKEPDGTVAHVGVGTRALLYPVEIDSFGCIETSGF